jgi:hypothetical protein
MEAFLVLDVEGACDQNIPWGYPNDIIVRVYEAECYVT